MRNGRRRLAPPPVLQVCTATGPRKGSVAAFGDQTVRGGLGLSPARGVGVDLAALFFGEPALLGPADALELGDFSVEVGDQVLGFVQAVLLGRAEPRRLGAGRPAGGSHAAAAADA